MLGQNKKNFVTFQTYTHMNISYLGFYQGIIFLKKIVSNNNIGAAFLFPTVSQVHFSRFSAHAQTSLFSQHDIPCLSSHVQTRKKMMMMKKKKNEINYPFKLVVLNFSRHLIKEIPHQLDNIRSDNDIF